MNHSHGVPPTLIGLIVLAALALLIGLAVLAGRRRGSGSGGGTDRGRGPRPPRPRSAPPAGRPGPAGRDERPGARPGGAGRTPAPREIWWAEVPFEDGHGSKDRPCLVLRVDGRTATVAKITSKHHAELPGVLALPPGTVADRQGRASWLELDELRQVPLTHFRRRVGPVDSHLWARVQSAHPSR
ncbi:type II toxin-antitoxin system PemK/MazF family toxin [Kitasatospora sp. NBC_01302]|uniref:type II toxin-antitoxin system PemK/MazF family toxin n=1 Tax=Kitasatospora sp. NBC_01302 TaxID=2903575 RepID=UPI002E1619EF|nr:type II toxin-antitoxin system PemK/MazF family toxin [Kitasatospora sp. NBC_01302]